MTCPVTYAAWKVLDKHFFSTPDEKGSGSFRGMLYEDRKEPWKELEEAIKSDEPATDSKRLRAFYCIEVCYFMRLPGSTLLAQHVSIRERLIHARIPRSYEGLTQLIDFLTQVERIITVDVGEQSLGGNMPRGMAGLLTKQTDSTRNLIVHTTNMAKTLRPMLKGSVDHIGKVGELFGYCSQDVSMEVCMQNLRTLLDISIHNTITPWRMNESQQ